MFVALNSPICYIECIIASAPWSPNNRKMASVAGDDETEKQRD